MKKIFNRLSSLPVCTILTTGRTGSDFLQSLLDSHPQVLTFNGILVFNRFWRNSICVNAGEFLLSDFIEEFIGKNIEKFKSKYDLFEGKDRLGTSRDQSIDIDTSVFKDYFMQMMEEQTINSKNCLLSIYGSYALVLNQDISCKKILLHHLHSHDELKYCLKDFPDSKIISMTRDPRSNYFSGVNNHKRYDPELMDGEHHYFYVKRIIDDTDPIKKFNNDYVSIKLEDLGDIKILKKISKWLNISYNEIMLKSTWAGLVWNADRLTINERKGSGFCKDLLKNDWQKHLSKKDKYILNFLMVDRLKYYKYNYFKRSVLSYFIIPLLIFLPMDIEKQWFRIFSDTKTRDVKSLLKNIFYYFKRCFYFFSVYIKIIVGEKFTGNLINQT